MFNLLYVKPMLSSVMDFVLLWFLWKQVCWIAQERLVPIYAIEKRRGVVFGVYTGFEIANFFHFVQFIQFSFYMLLYIVYCVYR